MARRYDYNRKSPQDVVHTEGNNRSDKPRNFSEQGSNREGHQQRSSYRDNSSYRDSSYRDNSYRDNSYRHNSQSSRYSARNRADETIEDIKTDMERIEKEIELEVKEIKSLRLGL